MLLPGPALISPGGGGAEITYQEFAVPKTVNGTGVNVCTTSPAPFDGGPVMVEFFVPRLTIAVGGWFFPALSDDLAEGASIGGTSEDGSRPYYGIGRMTPTAGSRTFTITASTNGQNTTLEADAVFWLRFTKVVRAS